MQVSISYAHQAHQFWENMELDEDSTVQQAIEQSGVLAKFPDIDLESQVVGIFGKKAKLDTPLQAGDRVEIYHAITADPETVERRDE